MNTYNDFDANDLVSDIELYEDTDSVVLALGLDGLVIDDADEEEIEPVEGHDRPTIVTTSVIEPQKDWKKVSKIDICRSIFVEHYSKPSATRKTIISLFMSQAGCTRAGASTYYQQLNKQATN